MPPVDEGFLHRLETAFARAPGAPTRKHGRLTWLMRRITEMTDEHLTLESVRRWFLGISKPTGANLTALCRICEVDPGWLIYGVTPTGTRRERVEGSSRATGAVYYALGSLLLDGLQAGMPAEDDELAEQANIDLEAIVGGRSRRFTVSTAEPAEDGVLVARPRLPSVANDHLIVIPGPAGHHAIFHVPAAEVRRCVEPKGDWGEVRMRYARGKLEIETAPSAPQDGPAIVSREAANLANRAA